MEKIWNKFYGDYIKMKKILYLIRHDPTEFNLKKNQGNCDFPLTKEVQERMNKTLTEIMEKERK